MRVILLLTMAFLPFKAFSQIDFSDWMLTLKFGLEQHDKRLFDYSEKEALLAMQPEFWGTYNWSLLADRKLYQNKKFTFFAGSGIQYQKATFLRPFDHWYFNQDNLEILRYQNKYEKIFLPINASGYLSIGNGFSIDLAFSTYILLFRKIENTAFGSDDFPYTNSTFELNSFEITSGINYEIGRFIIGLHSRLLNYQKIDKIIYNRTVQDPNVDQAWEFHNPLRFDFSFSYRL